HKSFGRTFPLDGLLVSRRRRDARCGSIARPEQLTEVVTAQARRPRGVVPVPSPSPRRPSLSEPAPPSSFPIVRVPTRPGPPLRFQLRPVAPSLRSFLATEAGGAVLLLAATVVALVWANSAWSGAYEDLWSTTAGWHVGPWTFEMDLHEWVNDAAMAVFFLVIGLEINREVTTGELRNRRTVAVPALGALGGLAVPALIYLAFNAGSPAQHGWGIVMSTDTAFLVGVLALFGPRCPGQLRLFLLTHAVVDDIGAITVMALFYTDDLWLPGLLVAGALVAALLVLRWLGVWRLTPYVLVGIALWGAVFASGVRSEEHTSELQ